MSNSSLNISQDVGGGTGYNFAFAAIHGGRAMDQQVMVNGMSVTSLTGTGGTRTNWSDGTAQEYGLQLAAHSAEIPYGGVFANILPKEGGNRFSGDRVRQLRHRRPAGRQSRRRPAERRV